jgi:hypothetical protein
MAEQNTPAPPQAKAKVYKIKNGALAIKHPSMGVTFTNEHLKVPHVIVAIQKEEKKGKTKGWIDANLELA